MPNNNTKLSNYDSIKKEKASLEHAIREFKTRSEVVEIVAGYINENLKMGTTHTQYLLGKVQSIACISGSLKSTIK